MSESVSMLRRCTEWSGVSLTASTSRRFSFRTTSAARQTRLCANPVAIAASVFVLHGAIAIPIVRNEPLKIAAAWSFSE